MWPSGCINLCFYGFSLYNHQQITHTHIYIHVHHFHPPRYASVFSRSHTESLYNTHRIHSAYTITFPRHCVHHLKMYTVMGKCDCVCRVCGKGVYAIFSDVPHYMQQLIIFKHRTEQIGGCFNQLFSNILQQIDETGSIVCVCVCVCVCVRACVCVCVEEGLVVPAWA